MWQGLFGSVLGDFFFQYALGIVVVSYSCLDSGITLVPPENLHTMASWLHPPQQPKKINQSRSETGKPDMIQEVRKRIERKLSIWTRSRAEEKPKLRSWSADSWPSFLWDNSKNYLMFSHNGSGGWKYCLKEGLIVLHTESDTNQKNVTFIDLNVTLNWFKSLEYPEILRVLTFFMAAVLSFKNLLLSLKGPVTFLILPVFTFTHWKKKGCVLEGLKRSEKQKNSKNGWKWKFVPKSRCDLHLNKAEFWKFLFIFRGFPIAC